MPPAYTVQLATRGDRPRVTEALRQSPFALSAQARQFDRGTPASRRMEDGCHVIFGQRSRSSHMNDMAHAEAVLFRMSFVDFMQFEQLRLRGRVFLRALGC